MDGQLIRTAIATIGAYIQEQKIIWHLWLSLLVLSMVEYVVGLGYKEAGVLLHLAFLFCLYFAASYFQKDAVRKLYLALSLAPLTRIINLSIPPFPLHPVFHYLLVGIPLLIAASLIAKKIGWGFCKTFFKGGSVIEVIGSYCLGAVIGLMSYLLFRPAIITSDLANLPFLITSIAILASSGFLEELLFRGILYRTAIEAMGQQIGWAYSSLIYASLHLCHCSAWAVLLALVSALILASFVRHHDSLIGAGVAHAIANIFLFFVGPLLF